MFDWKDFLELARYLNNRAAQTNVEKASKRSAVSRAYYAVYCFLRDFAEKNLSFSPQRTSDDHYLLVKYLLDLPDAIPNEYGRFKEQLRDIADTLRELRVYRNQCDYDANVENLDFLAAASIANADRVFNNIRSFEKSVDYNKIKAFIQRRGKSVRK